MVEAVTIGVEIILLTDQGVTEQRIAEQIVDVSKTVLNMLISDLAIKISSI